MSDEIKPTDKLVPIDEWNALQRELEFYKIAMEGYKEFCDRYYELLKNWRDRCLEVEMKLQGQTKTVVCPNCGRCFYNNVD